MAKKAGKIYGTERDKGDKVITTSATTAATAGTRTTNGN